MLREALGLSQHHFALLVEISSRSVPNIESGEKNIDVEILRKIKNVFFMTAVINYVMAKIEINDNLNEQLIKQFKKSKPELAALLAKTPKIVYAIKYNLLRSKFLNDFKETNEIRKYFEDQG
jgi:transcriptional regulator with XRE-family HTH domain